MALRERWRRIRARLMHWALFRLLVMQFWFRVVVIGFVLAGLAVLVSIPKVWVTTPAEIQPPARVSLIDLGQAWSLERKAQRLAVRGRHIEAAHGWQAALANHGASRGLLRGALRHLLTPELAATNVPPTSALQGAWLLRLSETNRADVTLVAQLYDKLEFAEGVLNLIEPIGEELNLAEEAVYLKALGREARWEEFGARWERVGPQFEGNEELALYHAAYQVGWGPPGTGRAGWDQIEAAVKDPELKLVANRLKLTVCARLMDLEGYESALRRLERAKADRLADQVRLWHLLSALGRREEAQKMARAHERPPTRGSEVLRLAEAFTTLGMQPHARAFLQRYADEFGIPGTRDGTGIWLLYTDTLTDLREWEELRNAALRLRIMDQGRNALAALSYYMEGRAEAALQHPEQATLALQRAASLPMTDPQMALQIGINLLRLGYAEEALRMLAPHEGRLAQTARYWKAVFEAHFLLKRDPLMLFKAAAQGLELNPVDPELEINYAAALLVNRRLPEQAARITGRLLQRNPDVLETRVNHALALAMNQQPAEAEQLLQTLRPEFIQGRDRTFYSLVWFEIYVQRGQFDPARAAFDQIDPQLLFPNQVRWLEEQRARFPRAGG